MIDQPHLHKQDAVNRVANSILTSKSPPAQSFTLGGLGDPFASPTKPAAAASTGNPALSAAADATSAPPKFDLDASPQPRHIRLLAEARCEITDLAKRLEEAEQRARVAETLGAADFDAVEAVRRKDEELVAMRKEMVIMGERAVIIEGKRREAVASLRAAEIQAAQYQVALEEQECLQELRSREIDVLASLSEKLGPNSSPAALASIMQQLQSIEREFPSAKSASRSPHPDRGGAGGRFGRSAPAASMSSLLRSLSPAPNPQAVDRLQQIGMAAEGSPSSNLAEEHNSHVERAVMERAMGIGFGKSPLP